MSGNIFMTKIQVERVRHLKNVNIEISDTHRKHLILTGKNGSGKTSVLEALFKSIKSQQTSESSHSIGTLFSTGGGTSILMSFSRNIYFKDTMFVYIPTMRNKIDVPAAIGTININDKNIIDSNVNKDFLKYILSLDYQLYGAQRDNNTALIANLTQWFDNLVNALRYIYDCQELQLHRDTKNLAFRIEMPSREPFALHEMSDGYRAFLNIYMELLMRMESDGGVVDYEKPAIVLIDEIETHLHVELQKRVLPFLVRLFPNVQFIVATHSPFVMTSLENAVVYDLEKNERLESPSFYSYDTIVESFLGTSMYSNELQRTFTRYKELCLKERTAEENDEFLRTKAELEIKAIPSTELYIAFQELEKARKAAKNGTPN